MENITDAQLHKTIKKALIDEGTILFIGSGVSAWSGIPSWRSFLDEFVKFIESKGNNAEDVRSYKDNNPLIAAGIGCNILSKAEFASFIRSVCQVNTACPSVIHETIINLGATCYITTNYDTLLEQTLSQRGLLKKYKVISNQKVLDCAEIFHISKKNFIFKPHGDVSNCESIILSAEQYQRLYENGDRAYVYKTLETLLLTRTVVFIGFSLTDPDFLHIVGKIKNDFKRNPRDHFAIVPDVSDDEKNYWFTNYGIQILSYETCPTLNGRDYSSLLPLLRSLATRNKKHRTKTAPRKKTWITQSQKFKLERYARYLIQQFKTPPGPVFPLMFQKHDAYSSYYQEVSSSEILDTSSQSFILTGDPGAGKTYFIKQYCLDIAVRLQKWCKNPRGSTFPKIPVYIDLKEYHNKGCLHSLIKSQFPEGIPIMDWVGKNKVILLFDAYNEVDKKFLDNRTCLQEIKRYLYGNDVVITSRFKEQLSDLSLLVYRISEIDKDYVEEFLRDIIPDQKQEEIIAYFQRPLFFNLLTQGKLVINSNIDLISPHLSYFDYLNTEFKNNFGHYIAWEELFQEFAYNLRKKGTETFSVTELYNLLEASKLKDNSCFDTDEIVNWLIDSQHILTPISFNNLSFFHQSITEYLAAHYLADQYNQDKLILKEELLFTRWDYVLLYAAAMIDKSHTFKYFQTLFQIDSILAIQASAYFRYYTEQIVSILLKHLLSFAPQASWDYWMELEEHFIKIPLMPTHENLLRRLMGCKDIIGGLAAAGLLRTCKYNAKSELLEEMFNNLSINDYNYSEALGIALSEYITLEEYEQIIIALGNIEIELEDHEEGLSYGFDRLAQNFQLHDIQAIFRSLNYLNSLQRNVFVDIIREDESQEGFSICLDMIKDGFAEAVFPACILATCSETVQLDSVNGTFLVFLSNILQDKNMKREHKWVIHLIYTLYQKCPQFAKEVRASLKNSDGIVRLTLFYVIGKNRKKSFRNLYEGMLYFNELPLELIGAFDRFEWEEYANDIIIDLLLQNRLNEVVKFISGNFNNKDNLLYKPSLSVFIKLIRNVIYEDSITDKKNDAFDKYDIGIFLSQYMEKDNLLAFYHVANKDTQRFFNMFVLNRIEDINIRDFTPIEMTSMIKDLSKYDYEEEFLDEILLSNISDKEFIESTLIPLLTEDNALLLKNVRCILERAGEHQGIRYISK